MTEHVTYFKRNKYNAVKTEYRGGMFDSKKEALHAQTLDLLKHAHAPQQRVVKYERQVKIPLAINGKLICNYYVDFIVTFQDGHVEYQEIKGFATNTWLLKEKLFRAIYPERTLIVIK